MQTLPLPPTIIHQLVEKMWFFVFQQARLGMLMVAATNVILQAAATVLLMLAYATWLRRGRSQGHQDVMMRCYIYRLVIKAQSH